MKKKLLTLALLAVSFSLFVSCDFLSTIQAVKGFYTEYQNFTGIYENAEYYTVLTETDLTISNTTIESILPSQTRVYVMFDSRSPYLYVEQNLEGVERKSLFEDVPGGLYIEYVIDESNLVTARIPTNEEKFEGNTNASFLNDSFSYEDVQNENKTGDRTYELDVLLTQAINLDALGSFIDELAVFDSSLNVLDNVVAHLVITFDDVDSTIDVTATVDEYVITFDDESTVTFSLSNRTVIKVPENFEMPNVFADPYTFIAPSDIQLARQKYVEGVTVSYPSTTNVDGYLEFVLEAGTYQFLTDESMVSLYKADGSSFAITATDEGYEVTVTEGGSYFLKVIPVADGTVTVSLENVGDDVVTTTTVEETTNEATTVETTTEEVTTDSTTSATSD